MYKRVAVCHSRIVHVSFYEYHTYQDYVVNASNTFNELTSVIALTEEN